MKEDNCLLCTSYQKFYSALKNINSFNSSKEFIDMVSCLDIFFSEFRNITFVLQKSISKTKYQKDYEYLRDKYLMSEKMSWFIEKRNETVKQKPIELEKEAIVDIYLFGKSERLLQNKFVYKNWENATSLEKQIKNSLKGKINAPELYLSIHFVFKENGNEIDILDRIRFGVKNMNNFLSEFDKIISKSCAMCKDLKEKVKNNNIEVIAGMLSFVRDYEYIPKENKLIKTGHAEMLGVTEIGTVMFNDERLPLEDNLFFKNDIDNEGRFKSFIQLHSVIYVSQKKHIMPTFFIIYNDNTFNMETFLADSKSTYYRKINEIASRIEKDKITSIFCVWECYTLPMENTSMNERYEERVKSSEKTLLCFYRIDKDIKEYTVCLDADLLEDNNEMYKYVNFEINNISKSINWQQYYSLRLGFAKAYHKYLNIKKIN